MPTYVRAALLASALLLPAPSAPAAAIPICQYVGTTGTLLGERVLANPCVGYAGPVDCTPVEPATAPLGLVVFICVPVV